MYSSAKKTVENMTKPHSVTDTSTMTTFVMITATIKSSSNRDT
jgi:hypothetical protein